MSREDWEPFIERKHERQLKRHRRLASSNTTNWDKLTDYHYRRVINGIRIDWWPSANKWQANGKWYLGSLPKWLRALIDEDDTNRTRR